VASAALTPLLNAFPAALAAPSTAATGFHHPLSRDLIILP